MIAEQWPEVLSGIPDSEPVSAMAEEINVERVRARWRLDRQRNRRRISQALDDVCIKIYGAEHAARYGIRDRWSR